MKKRNLYWGFFFIIIAVVLFGSFFNLFAVGNSIFKIVVTALLIAFAISNLPSLNFGGIIMPLTIAIIINKNILRLSGNTWWLFFAGAFLSIGLNMLFKRPRIRYYKKHDYDNSSYSYHFESDDYSSKKNDDNIFEAEINDHSNSSIPKEENMSNDRRRERASYDEESDHEYVRISASFTDRTRYVRADNFTNGSIENNFGQLRVYFDQSTFNANGSALRVDCSFGQVILYLPYELNVINNVSSTLGGVNDDFNRPHKQGPTLTISGDVTFGNLKIVYV